MIMFVDSALFAWLAYRYKSIPHGPEAIPEDDEKETHENRAFVNSDDDPGDQTKL